MTGLCVYAYARHDSVLNAPSAPAKTSGAQTQTVHPGEFGVEIPAGIMFGKFEKESGPFLMFLY